MEFGAKIKTLRNKRGITQEALAKAMGVTPQTVSKWENDVTMPDVALLPELSIFFGITIDELFSLTEEKQMELEPCNSDIISEYTNACGTYIPDWDCRNHHALIQELQEFVKNHPESRSASMWLLDNLMADGRLKEAEAALEQFVKLDDSFRCTLYRALLAKAKGDTGTEEQCRRALEEQYADSPEYWLVQFSLADMDACAERYEEAIQRYEKALELQPAPKYTDMPESMAHIYEILGEKEKAMECYKLALKIMKEDHGMIAGEEVERINRCIQKLVEK